ncbi:DNA/RNA non-specific endonuclease [Cyclobacterium plantarum]|uniref:DNA/RNA non-specific endonuclease n=1 Tax=Cyclobacterium plantarum TaxID=2716263 RepID=UPI003F72AA4D
MTKQHKIKSKRRNRSNKNFSLFYFSILVLIVLLAFFARKEWKKNKDILVIANPQENVEADSAENQKGKEQFFGEKEPAKEETHFFMDSDYIQSLLLPAWSDEKRLQVVHHGYYSLGYDESLEQASWVAYQLSPEKLRGIHKRTDDFSEDFLIVTGSAHPDDYYRSGYDRGHLAPAADFTYSEKAMESSFYMSNVSPQQPGFNRGIWKKIEEQVRSWAIAYENVLVITGPVVKQNERLVIGENQVLVPDYFFKVIFDIHPPGYKMLAFLLKNEKSDRPLLDHVVSVDSLEQFSGLNFFEVLPDSLEMVLENEIKYDNWFE